MAHAKVRSRKGGGRPGIMDELGRLLFFIDLFQFTMPLFPPISSSFLRAFAPSREIFFSKFVLP